MELRMSEWDLEELFDGKLAEICERDNLKWYQVIDGDGFEEIEEWAKTLNLNEAETEVFDNWYSTMCWDL